MNLITHIRFLVSLLLLWIGTADVYGHESHLSSCQPFHGSLNNLHFRNPPRRVLLAPLLSRDPHTTESPRWSEQPAHILKAFYRDRYHADVTVLRDVWNWNDFYQEVEQIMRQSPPFDRIIFISHGGFDGPVLKNVVFWQNLEIIGGKGKLLQYSEAQPGLKNVLSVTYDTENNPVFSDYMATRWPELATMKRGDVLRYLKGLEKQIQPLDRACYDRYCSPDRLATSPENLHEARREICQTICRKPLFDLKNSAEISPERFFHFTKTLSSLAAADGMIFFGACNPGSAAPEKMQEKDETELLINSTLAGGPHKSYVHLVSKATGRIAAGPIGESSAEDIVNRVIMLETRRPQRNLCIATPGAQ
ncbi:hypothetical protein [Methylomicrobium sp. Wu6]|uniref:hypothetical protein n=1 Tax=Methylomicrobium sp. Wu6 TaxID=3107928 RepID=UPI002DD670BE|nr:hypothetical protein [Methylomicrobium sp. Wu6]MEC4748459.1 hypothetical protein [Methylomicrobium sp. Wu6]